MELAPGTTLGGRYEARSRLGEGGMGEVWRCLDTRRGVDVAVKVVRAEVLTDATRRLFHDEVLATARLHHAVIPPVYDLVQDARGLALVLELRAGDPLSQAEGLTLEALLEGCAQVLEALAYAHARGVLHLDIKPDNVLLDRGAAGVQATLLDFGIAHAWRRLDESPPAQDALLGTFAYMAPEQLTLTRASLGPWTDLFALGAMVYRLVSGVSPFAEQDLADRPYRPAPRLRAAALGLPEELADLLEALLTPAPNARPTHAADVLRALRAVPTRGPSPALGVTRAVTEVATTPASAADLVAPFGQPEPTIPDPLPAAEVSEVAMPKAPAPRPGEYALFGLREIPLVGRDAQWAAIWEQLLAVREEGAARVIALTGPPGVGKSRLARAALERAHETGLAHTAQTAWSEGGAANEGLSGLVEHAIGLAGARGLDLKLALTRWMARYGGADERFANDVRLLLDPRGMATDADLAMRVSVDVIGRLASTRAVVLWLDEADRSARTLSALVARLRARGPIAILTTCAEDLPAELAESLAPDLTVALSPLEAEDTATLVTALLEVSPALAARVAERADGNPLLATQLIADLVEGEALAPSSEGYALAAGALGDALPADLEAVWERRLAREGLDPRLLGAVALARPRPSEATVERLAEALGPALSEQVMRAVRAGLLSRRRGRYEWIHGQLRAHLIARLPEVERPRLHAAAADALAPLVWSEDVQAERAQHLYGAGRAAQACAVMTEAIMASYHRADRAARARRSRTLGEWAERAGLPRHVARSRAELAHLAAQAGDRDAADAHLAAARAAEPSAWVRLRAAQVASLRGDTDAATGAAQAALASATEEEELEAQMHATGILALAAHRRRDLPNARRLFERAATLATEIGDGATEARALMHLGNLAPVESLPLFERALAAALAAGARREELATRQVYADALYLTGDRDGASSEMQTVRAQASELGIRQLASVAEIQLACWALRERDGERASEHLAGARAAGAAEGGRLERTMLAAIACAVDALAGRFEPALAALERLSQERGDLDTDELREVLEVARDAADPPLAAALDAALGRGT